MSALRSERGAKLLLRRDRHILHPADPVSEDYVNDVPHGGVIFATVWTNRSTRFHNLAMSYLHQVAQNNDVYSSVDELINYLAIETGNYTMFVGHDGENIRRLRGSIDFDTMDEVAFRRWMRRVQYIIARDIINGLTLEEYADQFNREAVKTAHEYYPK
jgi:hypothetical protein